MSFRARIVLIGSAVVMSIALAPPVCAERPRADLLAQARQRIREGDARGAARVAEQVAHADPGNGRAHFVLGLARYHATDYAGALAAFEDARQSAHPPAPGPLAINEGAALFALGRYQDAVRAFERATRVDPSLEALAAIYAAQASLGAERWEDARRYATRAEAMPAAALAAPLSALRAEITSRERAAGAEQARRWQRSARAALDEGRLPAAIGDYQQALSHADEAQLPIRERADLSYALGHARYRTSEYAAAARAFADAAALAPADADIRYMAALTDYQRGDLAAARLGFEQALALGLQSESRATAETYAEALAPGLRAAGSGWGLYLETGGGYDSNVPQLGAAGDEALSAEHADRASPVAAATAQIAYGWPGGRRLFLYGAYLFQQLAYLERTLDPFSVQLHRLRVDVEVEALPALRLGLAGAGELYSTGVRNLQAFQRSFSVEPSAALDIGHATTVASFTLDAKAPLSEQARPLAGRRWEVRLAQRLRGRSVRGEVALRHARENLGQRDYDLGPLDALRQGRYLIPFSHRSNAALFEGAGRWGPLQLGLGGGYEQLSYDGDAVLRAIDPRGLGVDLQRQRRHDRRVTGTLSFAWWLSRRWAVDLRYDLTRNWSTLRFSFDDKSFAKHAASAGLLFRQ